jgi:drug/metabolite transporter (DMT)-like permease
MRASVSPVMGARDWMLMLILSVFWGGSFFFNKIALGELPPFTIVLARVAIGGLALNILLLALGQRLPRSPALWRDFAMMGLLTNIIPFCLMVAGQRAIAIGLASVLNATTPLFTVLLAPLMARDEKVTPAKLTGVVLGLVGVAVLIGADALAGLDRGVVGEVMCLGAALAFALSGLYGRRFQGMGVSPLVTATGQVTTSAIMMLPIAALDAPWRLPVPSAAVWGALLCLGLLSTTLGYFLFYRILAAAGAINLMLVTFLQPAFAILLGAGILGERLNARQFAGMALIACGLAAMDGRLFARRAISRSATTGRDSD